MSIAHIFRRPDYTSETGQFINQLKADRPTLEAEQRAGRALLWEQPQDREASAGFKSARIAQQPYVYQNKG